MKARLFVIVTAVALLAIFTTAGADAGTAASADSASPNAELFCDLSTPATAEPSVPDYSVCGSCSQEVCVDAQVGSVCHSFLFYTCRRVNACGVEGRAQCLCGGGGGGQEW